MPVLGSPTTLTMLAANLDVDNCAVSGDGLANAISGSPAIIRIECKDRYSNAATPATSLKFGISLQQAEKETEAGQRRKGKKQEDDKKIPSGSWAREDDHGGKSRRKVRDDDKEEEARIRRRRKEVEGLQVMAFNGMWVDGHYQISYVAQKAETTSFTFGRIRMARACASPSPARPSR